MYIQQRLLTFVIRSNWILLAVVSLASYLLMPAAFCRGVIFGGLIVNINFHLLYRTLKKTLKPPHRASVRAVLMKYYLRFIVSGAIIFVLISKQLVNPVGLFLGLSVVVASIMLATVGELKKLLCKEAV